VLLQAELSRSIEYSKKASGFRVFSRAWKWGAYAVAVQVFDALSEKLQAVLSDVRSRGKLNEDDINKAMREIRLALLEADVNFRVVKQFTGAVKERALGHEVMESLNPGQQVVKIVNDELTALMGESSRQVTLSPTPPTVILMAGLQGSGKTTACGKLARLLKEDGREVALAACDVYRPAAVDQLVKVGAQAGATVYEQGTDRDPRDIAAWALDQAKREGKDALIVDTSGRLHVDRDLMKELADIKKRTKPHNVLLVVDAMTGQDAVNVAEQFAEVAEFDGVVMTKLDGDARGGAALSIKAVTGKPILYASTGEKLRDFEPFHPDRMASRILGMGDVLSFIEHAEKTVDADQAAELERKIRKQEFGLDDFLDQMKQIRRIGPIGNLLGMLPGFGQLKQLKGAKVDERELDRIQAIVTSMTHAERRNPKLIDGSRRKRIAAGSGTSVQAVNQLVKQFGQMQKMMRALQQGKIPSMEQLMRGQ
jgi:signal recognition particle subunit SRP54